MPWYVLFTKPRNEKKVEKRLTTLGIQAFCPTRIERRQWSDRIKKVSVPLLPSMVLVNLQEKERNKVFEVPGIVRYLHWLGKPAIVTQDEVTALEDIRDHQSKVLEVQPMSEGQEIELTNFGSEKAKAVVKKISGNYCWVKLKNLGYIVKIQL